MPFKTPFGSHYHETKGCSGATIPCDTTGLTPCAICCVSRHLPAEEGVDATGGTHARKSNVSSVDIHDEYVNRNEPQWQQERSQQAAPQSTQEILRQATELKNEFEAQGYDINDVETISNRLRDCPPEVVYAFAALSWSILMSKGLNRQQTPAPPVQQDMDERIHDFAIQPADAENELHNNSDQNHDSMLVSSAPVCDLKESSWVSRIGAMLTKKIAALGQPTESELAYRRMKERWWPDN